MVVNKNSMKVVEQESFGMRFAWDADIYVCPQCGYGILAGFSEEPELISAGYIRSMGIEPVMEFVR